MAWLPTFCDLIKNFAEINKTVISPSCDRLWQSFHKHTSPFSFAGSNAHPLTLGGEP